MKMMVVGLLLQGEFYKSILGEGVRKHLSSTCM